MTWQMPPLQVGAVYADARRTQRIKVVEVTAFNNVVIEENGKRTMVHRMKWYSWAATVGAVMVEE